MSDEVFDELRARLDPLVVARRLGLPTTATRYFLCPNDACVSRKKGKQRKTALAHNDGYWICPACGDAKGDAVDLIMWVRGCSKGDAIQEAKDQAGMVDGRPMPPPPPPPRVMSLSASEAERARRVLTIATEHYERVRREGGAYLETLKPWTTDAVIEQVNRGRELAIRYLNRRGLPPLAEHPVPLGIVPAWDTGLLARLRQDFGERAAEVATAHGLARRSKRRWWETYHGRVWLPWQDADGLSINAKGRAIEGLPGIDLDSDGRAVRVMHSLRTRGSDNEKPHTVRPTHPFGWRAACQLIADGADGPLLIVEGELDALSAMHVGRPAVATGGTSGVGRAVLLGLLEDLKVDPLVLFDGDVDSSTHANTTKKAQTLAQELDCKWVTLPLGDLNDLLQTGRLYLVRGIDEAVTLAKPPPAPEPPPRQAKIRLRHGPDDVSQEGHPHGWGTTPDGELWRFKGLDDDNKPRWEPTHLFHPPMIEWRGRDVYDQRLILGLRGRAAGLGEVELAVPRDRLRATREIVTALSPVGYDVQQSTAALLVRYLADYEREFAGMMELRTGASQMGWHGSSFLYGDEVMGPSDLSYIGSEPQRIAALGQQGTREGWIEGVLRPLERHPLAMVGLYAAFAAPVLQHVPDMTGFAVEYAGLSSRGKSTVSSAIASAFGDPRLDAGLLRPPMDTVVALEMYASFQGSLPLFWEDVHLVDPREKARDIAMAWVNGAGKGRGRRDGEGMQKTRRWKSVAVLTGEASVTGSTMFGGVGSRVLTFPPPLPDANRDDLVIGEIREIERARVRHFGHAGREWVRWLVDGGVSRVLEAFDEWLPVLQRKAPLAGTAQRWAKAFALVIAVAQEAHAVIGGHDVTSDVIEVAMDHLASVAPPDQAAVAMDTLLAWVAMDLKGGIDSTSGEPDDFQHRAWFRREDSGVLCVGIVEARRRLSEMGVHLPDVQAEWLRRGWTKDKRRVAMRSKHYLWAIPIERHIASDGLDRARELVESEALH